MAKEQVIDVTRFIDERRMNRFNAKIVVFTRHLERPIIIVGSDFVGAYATS